MTSATWRGYFALHKELLSHAELIQHLTKSQDEVRRREIKRHPELLKNRRYARLKNETNRTEKQEKLFQSIQNVNLEVRVAWRLRQDFRDLFGSRCYADAKERLLQWIQSVKGSAIQEMIKVAERFERHFTGGGNALCRPQSNSAFMERFRP